MSLHNPYMAFYLSISTTHDKLGLEIFTQSLVEIGSSVWNSIFKVLVGKKK